MLTDSNPPNTPICKGRVFTQHLQPWSDHFCWSQIAPNLPTSHVLEELAWPLCEPGGRLSKTMIFSYYERCLGKKNIKMGSIFPNNRDKNKHALQRPASNDEGFPGSDHLVWPHHPRQPPPPPQVVRATKMVQPVVDDYHGFSTKDLASWAVDLENLGQEKLTLSPCRTLWGRKTKTTNQPSQGRLINLQ